MVTVIPFSLIFIFYAKSRARLGSEQGLEFLCKANFAVLSLVEIRGEKVSGIVAGLESFWEHIVLSNQFAFCRRGAVNLLDNFVELDPTVFGGRFVSGNGHNEGNKTVGTSAGNGSIVDKRVAESNSLGNVGFVVSGEEEVERHIGISSVIGLVDLGRVGVNIVGLDHTLGSQDLSTLIVSERRLTADINHGLNTSRVSDNAGSGIIFFRALVFSDFHINVGGTNGKNVNRVGTGQESSHIEIVDGHISKDTAATLDVGSRWRSRVAGAQFDLQRNTTAQYKNRTSRSMTTHLFHEH